MVTTTQTRVAPGRETLSFTGLSHFEQARELVGAIQQLALARSIAEIQEIVGAAARRLTGADGATFVLREGNFCHYADEDAISPLWKGQRFPLETCISGWAMLNRQPAVIEDIYADDRIPHDAYRPTFVKSLAMVPIRTRDPVGAIGNYWATRHDPTAGEVELLQALADSTAVAMENVRVYLELEQRVAERTRELQESNDSVRTLYDEARRSFERARERSDHHLAVLNTLAHEVRGPLNASQWLLRGALRDDALDGQVRSDLQDVASAVSEAVGVVTRQLDEARLEAGVVTVNPQPVDVAGELAALRAMFRAFVRSDAIVLSVDLPAAPIELRTDPVLLGHVLRNLLTNALKFTDAGEVSVSAAVLPTGEVAFAVADTGLGIAEDDIPRIFEQWGQVEDGGGERPAGSGLGLPLVRRLVDALGGRLELESTPGQGSTFTVVLPSGTCASAAAR